MPTTRVPETPRTPRTPRNLTNPAKAERLLLTNQELKENFARALIESIKLENLKNLDQKSGKLLVEALKIIAEQLTTTESPVLTMAQFNSLCRFVIKHKLSDSFKLMLSGNIIRVGSHDNKFLIRTFDQILKDVPSELKKGRKLSRGSHIGGINLPLSEQSLEPLPKIASPKLSNPPSKTPRPSQNPKRNEPEVSVREQKQRAEEAKAEWEALFQPKQNKRQGRIVVHNLGVIDEELPIEEDNTAHYWSSVNLVGVNNVVPDENTAQSTTTEEKYELRRARAPSRVVNNLLRQVSDAAEKMASKPITPEIKKREPAVPRMIPITSDGLVDNFDRLHTLRSEIKDLLVGLNGEIQNKKKNTTGRRLYRLGTQQSQYNSPKPPSESEYLKKFLRDIVEFAQKEFICANNDSLDLGLKNIWLLMNNQDKEKILLNLLDKEQYNVISYLLKELNPNTTLQTLRNYDIDSALVYAVEVAYIPDINMEKIIGILIDRGAELNPDFDSQGSLLDVLLDRFNSQKEKGHLVDEDKKFNLVALLLEKSLMIDQEKFQKLFDRTTYDELDVKHDCLFLYLGNLLQDPKTPTDQIVDYIKFLTNKSQQCVDNVNRSVLMIILSNNRFDVAEAFLEKETRSNILMLNKQDLIFGESALHILASTLVEEQQGTNDKEKCGKILDLMKDLIGKGADPKAKNPDLKTPFDIIGKKNAKELEKLKGLKKPSQLAPGRNPRGGGDARAMMPERTGSIK